MNIESILRNAIVEKVQEKEARMGFTLAPDDKEFLVSTLLTTTDTMIKKYIGGAKEHYDPESPGFVDGVDHLSEIRNEAIDLIMYSGAAIYKRNKQSKSKQ